MYQCPWCRKIYNSKLKSWEQGPGYFEPGAKKKTCPDCRNNIHLKGL